MVAEPKIEARVLTAEQYFQSPRFARSELINGMEIEQMPPGFDHGEYAAELCLHLKLFLRRRKLGRISVEGGYILKRNPDLVVGPDVSFLSNERLQNLRREKRGTDSWIEGAPTLAVEILSPSNSRREVEDKTHQYLQAGAQQVWIVDPKKRTVTVFAADAEPQVFAKNQTLDGGEILPGFALPLEELFA